MYIDPETVISPKNKVKNVQVLFNSGPVYASWSLARLEYEGRKCIGIRWNGDDTSSKKGVPLANAHPVWFILPREIEEAVEQKVEELNGMRESELLLGYRQLAADEEQETAAEQWSEGLIGDAY